MNIRFMLLLCLMLFIFLIGCGRNNPDGGTDAQPTAVTSEESSPDGSPTPTNAPAQPIVGVANVDSIEVIIMESFPVQINVKARGTLPNGCVTIDEVAIDRADNEFNIAISTIQDPIRVCTQAVVPFEETIPLDVLGLEAGSYQVNVNGRTGSFTLSVDNVADAAPTNTPTPESEATLGLINGRVWHDLCAVAPDNDEDSEGTPGVGCIASVDGGFQADGLLEDSEPGISGVSINLGEGECPATGFSETETDDDGDYIFVDVPAGTYCVSIDASAPGNETLLESGTWTVPESGESAITVELNDGEVNTGINFGWDYEFLPIPDIDLTNCLNSIEFLQDINIPDDTIFGPGQTFEKRWLLRNNGTCPWTEEYALAFLDGGLVPDEILIPLTEVVVAGQSVEVAASFAAPQEEGTYRSNFQLQDANGTLFGINGLLEEAFWVQIVVGEPDATPEPNSSVIGGVVWDDICFIGSDGSPSAGCVEIDGSGFYRGDGSLNFNDGRLADITVTLLSGECNPDGTINAANIISTAVTDNRGLYRFTGLDEDLYCVAINAFSDDNVDLLIPGDWTWPFPGVGQQGITLDAGEELLEVDFGWDFRE